MANLIISVLAGSYAMRIHAIMLPSSGFSVAHWKWEQELAIFYDKTCNRLIKRACPQKSFFRNCYEEKKFLLNAMTG